MLISLTTLWLSDLKRYVWQINWTSCHVTIMAAAVDKYVCKLDARSVEKAKKELNEDAKDRLNAVDALRTWIQQQPHITFECGQSTADIFDPLLTISIAKLIICSAGHFQPLFMISYIATCSTSYRKSGILDLLGIYWTTHEGAFISWCIHPL